MEEQKKENIEKQQKKGFFKKAWYSITKIEKYPEMAAEGVAKALKYLVKLAIIISIVIGAGTIYQTDKVIKNGIEFIQNKVGEFSYKDGNLDVSNDEPLITENTSIGKIIIDTKVSDEEGINKYINSINNEMGIILLKDKLIIKGISGNSTINYSYNDFFNQMDITEFSKEDVINFANSNNIWNFYLSLFLMVIIYTVVIYILSILWNAVIISLFGYIATWFAKIKMRYAAIFNMSVYALTLSVLLNIIYIGINIFVDFDIKYFQVMYMAVASIYLVAAIFIIKSDFIKKQIEVTKIIEAQEKIKQEETKKENDNKEKEKNKPKEKQKDEEEDKEQKDGAEPEGSQA